MLYALKREQMPIHLARARFLHNSFWGEKKNDKIFKRETHGTMSSVVYVTILSLNANM